MKTHTKLISQTDFTYRSASSFFAQMPLIAGLILFFLMVVFPRSQQLAKIPFLAINILYFIFFVLWRLKISRWVLTWFIFFLFFGIFWGLLGLVNAKEFALDFFRLNVGWVLVYAMLILGIQKNKYLELFLGLLPFALFAISFLGLNFLLYGLHLPHFHSLLVLDPQQRIGFHAGYTQITSHNLGSLFFLMPFLFSVLLIDKNKRNFFNITCFLIGTLIVFLSGRRALWFVFLLMPIIHFSLLNIVKAPKKTKRSYRVLLLFLLLTVFVSLSLFWYMEWDLQIFLDRLTFYGDEGKGVDYRLIRISELIEEVVALNILFGTGGGSAAFEVSPIKIFHETGIFGFLLYQCLFLSVFFKISLMLKKNTELLLSGLPLLSGGICFFLSLWTNPYFGSFDFMWTLFILVLYININSRNI